MSSRCDQAARRFEPEAALRHPLFGGGALVLALNDHVLKGAGVLPDLVTGKLSDAAGLLVAPLVLAVVLRARSAWAVAACHVAPLLAMALLKLSPAIADGVVTAATAFGETWAIVADPTDLLVAVPAALASWWWLARPAFVGARAGGGARSLATREIVLVGLAALACGATSRTPPQAPAIHQGRVIAGPWAEDETYVIDANGRALRQLDVWSGDPPLALEGHLWSYRNGERAYEILAIDLQTGARRVVPTPGVVITDIGGVDAQSIFVRACAGASCASHAWHAIDRASGRVRWTSPNASSAPIVVGAGIVATTDGRHLFIRDAHGRVIEQRRYDGDVTALAVGDALWVVDATGDVEALRPSDGAMLERWSLGERGKDLAGRARSSQRLAAAAGSRLYAAVSPTVFALEIGAPRPLWEGKGSFVAVSGDAVVVDDGDGGLRGVESRTGITRWTAPGAWGRFAVGDGIVARRDDDTYVTILDARTGRQLSRFDLDEGEVARD